MEICKSIADAVKDAIKDNGDSNYWVNRLEPGALRSACVNNRLASKHGEETRDYCVMRFAIIRNINMSIAAK